MLAVPGCCCTTQELNKMLGPTAAPWLIPLHHPNLRGRGYHSSGSLAWELGLDFLHSAPLAQTEPLETGCLPRVQLLLLSGSVPSAVRPVLCSLALAHPHPGMLE
ncbi:maestro heat-like repeat family member 5 [Platysternon megacephalum]|uniref:Maestro heat-like repeat family member 5 n=1 Tax=Platysternon megacephalum TaxID=55544 RepID=A0A4D9DM07_9SAUR|nr:maestro heat-like repeat family member 5 [Platysternon megacephalum]